MANELLLFLDFDGVLHPQHEGMPTPKEYLFCHLSRFEAVMIDFPAVRIVISSTWRTQFPLEKLKGYFSPTIQTRIIGITPYIESGKRIDEILLWLRENGVAENSQWIALDDAGWEFAGFKDHLVECRWYNGFQEREEIELRRILECNS